MRKNLKKLISTSIIIGSLTFIPTIDFNGFTITSVAHASIQTYTGTGEYIMSKKETPEFAESNAKKYAERNALEQAGLFLSSSSTSVNGRLTKDEIITVAGGILQVIDSKFEVIPIQDGYIKYRVTVTVQIDTSKLDEAMNEFLNRDYKDQSMLVALQKNNEQLQKRVKELENQIANAKTQQDRNKINAEIQSIDKDALANQKLEEASKWLENGNYNEAIRLCNETIQIKSNFAEAYFLRGLVYGNLVNYDLAIKDYSKVIQINSNPSLTAFTYILRGGYYHSVEEDDELAISDYNKAIQINANNILTALAYSARAFAHYDDEKAKEDFKKAINLAPNLSTIYCDQGIYYLHFADDENYEQAIIKFNKAIQIDPDYKEAYYGRGETYVRLKKYKEAISDFSKAIKIDQNYMEAYVERGDAYLDLKIYNSAIADFSKAIQLNPKKRIYNSYGVGSLYYKRGLAYKELGEDSKAQTDFAKAKELGYKN